MGSKKLNLSTNPKLIQRRKNKEHTRKKLKLKKKFNHNDYYYLCFFMFADFF